MRLFIVYFKIEIYIIVVYRGKGNIYLMLVGEKNSFVIIEVRVEVF